MWRNKKHQYAPPAASPAGQAASFFMTTISYLIHPDDAHPLPSIIC